MSYLQLSNQIKKLEALIESLKAEKRRIEEIHPQTAGTRRRRLDLGRRIVALTEQLTELRMEQARTRAGISGLNGLQGIFSLSLAQYAIIAGLGYLGYAKAKTKGAVIVGGTTALFGPLGGGIAYFLTRKSNA